MDRADILEKVKSLVVESLSVDGDAITEQTTFDDLGADSLDKLELVVAFEDEFNASIDDDDLQKINTIGDAIDAIVKAQ